MIDSRTFGGRNRTNDRFAAPILWRETVFLELFFHPVDICSRKIDLVKCDHDFDVRRGLGVIDRFDRLRHDAVVGRDNEYHNVGHIGATRAHRGEGGVTWRVDEGNFRSVVINAIGADVLRDPADLAGRDTRLSDRVHKCGLTVVNVPHERDNGRPRLELLLLFNDWRRRCHDHLFDFVNASAFFTALLFKNKPVVFGDLGCNIRLNGLVDIGEDVVCHQLCDELMRF